MRALLIGVLLLAGCGVDLNDNGSIDYQDGIPVFPHHKYKVKYDEVQECTGLHADPPLVVVVNYAFWPIETEAYYSAPRRLVLLESPDGPVKHEYIHHLLYSKTGDLDRCHTSPLFEQCGDTDIMDKC